VLSADSLSVCYPRGSALSGVGFGTLDLSPERRVGLFQQNGVPVELTLGISQVIVDLGLMTESDEDGFDDFAGDSG
jgi:hypothetical protein